MNNPNFNREQTAELLDYVKLVQCLKKTALEYGQGEIHCPPRASVPLAHEGVLLSMPASSANLAIHKLVNVQSNNSKLDLPTIHSVITVVDAQTGAIKFQLDGTEVTGRRTAALSMLAIKEFGPKNPQAIVIIGAGAQASYHVSAIHAIFPEASLYVKGRTTESSQRFRQKTEAQIPGISILEVDAIPDHADVVIMTTTSMHPVYDLPAKPGRLIIGTGAFRPDMAEIGPCTLSESLIIVDEPSAMRHEAGDLIQACVDWERVIPLSKALCAAPPRNLPVTFKSIGSAAWDLAAARVAAAALSTR